MPPRNKRQRAGALNYRKRKDLARVVEVEGVRVEGSEGERAGRTGSAEVAGVGARSGSVEVEGVGAGGSGSVEVEGVGAGRVEVEGVGGGGSGSVEVEGEGSGSVEVEEGDDECGPSASEEAGTVQKRRRLSAIAAMADESWLDNLPRDDLQHMALLLYGRLPTIFGLSKTDTAAVVGEVLHKNERTI